MTSVINIKVDKTNYEAATRQIRSWAQARESRYVCVANVHMLMEAYDSTKFRDILNDADMVTPDGMPLVWMMRAKGQGGQTRVYGPTLMLHVLNTAANQNLPVGFYGSKPEVLDELVHKILARYENLKIAFSCSPSFEPIRVEEDAMTIQKINESGTQILFVGLGCPKQEIWMADHRNKVKAVMIGVGAAFDFHAGLKPQAPAWMQKMGVEWLFRLFTEPLRLWKRYLYHNPRFLVLAVADLFGMLKTTD